MVINALETLSLLPVVALAGMAPLRRHRKQCNIKAWVECGKCKKRREKQRPVVSASFLSMGRKLLAAGAAEAGQKRITCAGSSGGRAGR